VAALLALGSLDGAEGFFFLAYIPVVVFWGLDGYFLWQEKIFRRVYNSIRIKENKDIDFCLNPKDFQNEESWPCAVFSITLLSFYGVLIVSILLVVCLS
jgi:hypothetical protein